MELNSDVSVDIQVLQSHDENSGSVLRVPRRNTVVIPEVPVTQHCPKAPGFTSSDKRFHL